MTTRTASLFLAIRSRHCDPRGQEEANPIFREIILQTLPEAPHEPLPQIPASWLTPDGRLHKDVLLRALLDFWRKSSESSHITARDHILTPYLVLSAFLQWVANGGSWVGGYAIGHGRIHRRVRHQGETLAIETRVWRPQKPDPLQDGLKQIDSYLAGLGLHAGWLAMSDCLADASDLPERLCAALATAHDGREVTWIAHLGCAGAIHSTARATVGSRSHSAPRSRRDHLGPPSYRT